MRKIGLPVEEIVTEYEAGVSPRDLADKHGVGIDTIVRRLTEAGVTLRTMTEASRAARQRPLQAPVSGVELWSYGQGHPWLDSTLAPESAEALIVADIGLNRQVLLYGTRQELAELGRLLVQRFGTAE